MTEPEAALPASEPAPTAAEPSDFPYATWGPWTALATAVAALFAGILIGLPFLIADGSNDSDDFSLFTTVGLQISAGVTFILVPILVSLLYDGGLRSALRRLGFVSFRPGRAILWMVAGIASYFAFAIIYSAIFGQPKQDDIAGDFGPLGIQIALIVVLAPLSEEICFRGMLFGGFRTRLPMWAAAIGAGLVFGALHYSTGLSAVPSLVVLGAIFAVVYERTGSIWPPILMHAFNNALALVVLSSS